MPESCETHTIHPQGYKASPSLGQIYSMLNCTLSSEVENCTRRLDLLFRCVCILNISVTEVLFRIDYFVDFCGFSIQGQKCLKGRLIDRLLQRRR